MVGRKRERKELDSTRKGGVAKGMFKQAIVAMDEGSIIPGKGDMCDYQFNTITSSRFKISIVM